MTIDEINNELHDGSDLTPVQASFAMTEILNGRTSDEQLGAFITRLHHKGETAIELASLVTTMWANSPKISVDVSHALDTCGTGGDKSNTFNISTAVALVLSATGIPIAKHGNRAASSQCGAADVLEALDIPVDLSVAQGEQLFRDTGFVFLFAPTYHPGMRFAAPVRKALGVPTTFNYLGPLANPYHAPYRMHGVSKASIVRTYIETLAQLDVKRAYVFHGHGGLDEISLSGPTEGFMLDNGEITPYEVDPNELGIDNAPISALVGGDAETNAHILRSIFNGDLGPARDIVLLNAAMGYQVAKSVDLESGFRRVRQAIDSGDVRAKVDEISAKAVELSASGRE